MYDEMEEEYDGDKWDEDEYRCTLYLRFPTVRPSTEEIMALHPDILHVDYPKIPNTRFCYLIFANNTTANEARKELLNVVYKDKGYLVVEFMRKFEKQQRHGLARDGKKRRLLFSELPAGTTAEQLKESFRACIHARVFTKGDTALLVFHSNRDAEAVVNDKDSHKVNGAPVKVDFLKKPLSEDQMEKKRVKWRERKKLKKEIKKKGRLARLIAEGKIDPVTGEFIGKREGKNDKGKKEGEETGEGKKEGENGEGSKEGENGDGSKDGEKVGKSVGGEKEVVDLEEKMDEDVGTPIQAV